MLKLNRIMLISFLLNAFAGLLLAQTPHEPTHLIIYRGTTVTQVPLSEIDSIRFESLKNSPMVPLEYVAEYNVGKTPGTFAESQQNDASGYFPFEEVNSICPKGYHTPTRQEAAVLFPLFGPKFEIYIWFDTKKETIGALEAIQVGDVKASYLNDYKSPGGKVCYAIRFQKAEKEAEAGYPAATDNSLRTAYRYEIVGQMAEGNLDAHMKISARHLGDDFSGSMDDVAKEEFWTANNEADVVRILPSAIYYHPQFNKEVVGAGAYYWTTTPHETQATFVWTIAYISKMAYISYNSDKFKFGVRPFKNTL